MSIKFIVYAQDGEILRTGSCPTDQMQYQAGEGETVVENTGDWNPVDHYWDGTKFAVKPPVIKTEAQLKAETLLEIRRKRFAKLQSSDWTQVADAPLTTTQRESWLLYRQQLRDLPQTYAQATSLDDVVWPTPPQ